MQLISFSITNYRSITRARKLDLSDATVLIGPNNEGKSNILRALVLSLTSITGRSRRTNRILRRTQREDRYDWERDFPLHLQEKRPKGASVFRLEFELTEQERAEFQKEVKSTLNTSLPIELTFSRSLNSFDVKKPGRGGKALSGKSDRISEFMASRLDFEYIPAIRTADAAEAVVERLVSVELVRLEAKPEYKAAIESIAKLQEPVLKAVSDSISNTLQTFLPAVTNAKVTISDDDRYRAMRRSCSIVVDDGTETLLQYKGDGVQSLAALSLMRYSALNGSRDKSVIIAVEEPESHLHPDGIHALSGVLKEIASKHQLVLTTHCPLFVDRRTVANNVLVREKQAKPAKSVKDIRESLGVRASDNLLHAELVLLVEGPDDARAMAAVLPTRSGVIADALAQGTLAIDHIGGSGNLAYRALMVRNALCEVHCFVDDDQPGRDAVEKARVEGVLEDGDINLCSCQGMSESEIEDLVDPEKYTEMIKTRWRVDLAAGKPLRKAKWSDRVGAAFKNSGKRWDNSLKNEVKAAVSDLVCAAPETAIATARESSLVGLVTALEIRLKSA